MNGVICPKCQDESATVSVSLDDGDTCRCSGCDEEYSADAVRKMVESWGPVLAWLEKHPARG